MNCSAEKKGGDKEMSEDQGVFDGRTTTTTTVPPPNHPENLLRKD